MGISDTGLIGRNDRSIPEMTEQIRSNHGEHGIRAATLNKLAVTAVSAAYANRALRILNKWVVPAYSWAKLAESDDQKMSVYSGLYRAGGEVNIDDDTQVEVLARLAPERRLRLRSLNYELMPFGGNDWMGQLDTYTFEWDATMVYAATRERKSVPSMTPEDVEQLRQFYGLSADHPQLSEILAVTDRQINAVDERECIDLLTRFRERRRQAI